ncbi:hypothetical protein [Bacillus sp. NPDC094106]|uniref:hypothetical protein n=1 Tax=Bacillus sp. NPDC094106 TaxID=3363949 RepID=UPI0037F8E0AF
MRRTTLKIGIILCSILVFMVCLYEIWGKNFRTAPVKDIVKEFVPQDIKSGSKSTYNLELEMNTEGLFNAETSITIQNQSDKE